MATHSSLTGADLHEPKGASGAVAKSVYVSNGAGSGTWDIAEPKGTDTALAGSILVADGAGGSSWGINQVDFIGVACSDSTTQTAPGVGLKKSITLDTNLVQEDVTHVAGSADFTIVVAGFYNLICVPQIVTGGGGSGQVELSWELNTGAGFGTIPGSPIIVAYTAADEGTPVCDSWVALQVGDVVRSSWATDSANVNIQPVTSLVGDIIPSVQQYVTLHGN